MVPDWQREGDAVAAMADSLRQQITERVKEQQQLIVVSALVAGAMISFASHVLTSHPEVMALVCLLYVGISLAVLRHDQEITILAGHLLDAGAFGRHAEAQARWEQHKFAEMQSGLQAVVLSSAQTAGNYGLPTLAVLATFSATVIAGPNLTAVVILVAAVLFSALFAVGAVDVVRRYRALGHQAQVLLAAQET